jgi:hypothetical protein
MVNNLSFMLNTAVSTMHTENSCESATEIDLPAAELAAESVARWRQIDVALTPILGRRGMVAIYRQALNLTHGEFPWLTTVSDSETSFDNFVPLLAALEQQTSATIAAANLALHRTFNSLLVSLIGESLSERLLASIDACFHREALQGHHASSAERKYA